MPAADYHKMEGKGGRAEGSPSKKEAKKGDLPVQDMEKSEGDENMGREEGGKEGNPVTTNNNVMKVQDVTHMFEKMMNKMEEVKTEVKEVKGIKEEIRKVKEETAEGLEQVRWEVDQMDWKVMNDVGRLGKNLEDMQAQAQDHHNRMQTLEKELVKLKDGSGVVMGVSMTGVGTSGSTLGGMTGVGGKATGKGAADIQKLRKTVYFGKFDEKTVMSDDWERIWRTCKHRPRIITTGCKPWKRNS